MWHERFGHQNYIRAKRMLRKWNIKFKDTEAIPVHEVCLNEKTHRLQKKQKSNKLNN